MKTLLITGANRGIGLEFAAQYSKDGWQVFGCCRNPASSTALKKIKNLELLCLDVNNSMDLQQLGDFCKKRPIDLLINNAGVAGTPDDFKTVTEETLLATLHTNTIAPVLVTQTLIPSLELGNNSIIVNINSYYGSIESYPDTDYIAYQISKTALNSATKNMAKKLVNRGIIAISMNPGWVKTDMGGESAILNVDESVYGMRKVIAGLSLSDSGKFFSYDGSQLPW